MSITSAYLDIEIPLADQGFTVVASAICDIYRTAGSPANRGGNVMRIEKASGGVAYAKKSLGTLAAGETLQIGYWFNPVTPPANLVNFNYIRNSSLATMGYNQWSSTNTFKWVYYNDTGAVSTSTFQLPNDWSYLTAAYRRATTTVAADGWVKFYVNGAKVYEATGLDNYDTWSLSVEQWYGRYLSSLAFVCELDEIKIVAGENYPEPYVATPETETPCPARTVVLYRSDNADSLDFAYYCHSSLGVPLSNLCPLPNATGTEALADYATFQTEVETDLAAWLARNPTVAANCTHFLIGYGVPGYFTHSGKMHSATARLMNYGTAFAGAIDNPLYQTTDRLTKTALAGKYLCTRSDSQNLAAAKTILDNSAADVTIAATDKLHTDKSTWAATLAAQKLRIETAAIPATLTNDAFVFGDATGLSSFGSPAGNRAGFVDDTADSADTLRATSEAYDALSADYAAAMGFAAADEYVDIEAFFEMLHAGGTFAEAMMVAASKIDGYLVTAGCGLFGATFQQAGYNIYRGITQDDMTLVAAPRNDVTEVDVSQSGGTACWYKITAVSAAGVEEHNTHVICLADIDEADELQPSPLPVPVELTAEQTAENSLELGFCWEVPPGYAQPTGFEVFSDSGSGTLDMENPVAVVSITDADRLEHAAVVGFSALPIQLAVRATRDTQAGPLSKTLIVPAPALPLPPVTL